MNWYKKAQNFETQQSAFGAVRSALMAMKYLHPEVNPAEVPFEQLSGILAETGKVPQGVDPQRFAAMVLFYIKNGEEGL